MRTTAFVAILASALVAGVQARALVPPPPCCKPPVTASASGPEATYTLTAPVASPPFPTPIDGAS